MSISVAPPNLDQSSLLILLSGSLPIRGLIHLSSSAVPHHLKQSAFCFFSQGPILQENSFTCLFQPFNTISNKVCWDSLRTGGLINLSSSAVPPDLEQSVFCFLFPDPFRQEDCFTCLVKHLNTIWNKERCDSYPWFPSHRRNVSLVLFSRSSPFWKNMRSDSFVRVPSHRRIRSLLLFSRSNPFWKKYAF